MNDVRLSVRVFAALSVSICLHVAILTFDALQPSSAPAAGNSDVLIQALGNSFSDFAAGRETPQSVTEPIEPMRPVETLIEEPVTAEPVDVAAPNSTEPTRQTVTSPSVVEQSTPTDSVEPDTIEPTPSDVEPSVSSDARQSTPIATQTNRVETVDLPTQTSVAISTITPVEPLSGEAAQQQDAATPNPASTLTPVAPVDTVQPLDTPTVPQPFDTSALREEAQATRQRFLEEEQERRRVEEAARPRRPAPGNADRNSVSGQPEQATRAAPAQTPRTSPAQAAPTPSTSAAVENYPGRVYRRIQRTRQRGVRERGTARVRFSVTGSGGLGSISISASSGSGAVDQAAIDHVRRAAPFPAPPSGAQTTFVVPITFR
jgi:protein TonB